MVYFCKEQIPRSMGGKLQTKKFGTYKIVRCVNDNTYSVDLLEEFGVSKSFNNIDLTPYFN